MTGLVQAWRMPRAEVLALLESDTLGESDIAGALGWMHKGVQFIAPQKEASVKRTRFDLRNGMERNISMATSAAGILAIGGLVGGGEDIAKAASEAGGW